jgi:putative ABC transport system permease protein
MGEVSPDEQRALEKAVRQLPAALDAMELTAAERTALKKLLARPTGSGPRSDVLLTEEFVITGVVRLPTKEDEEREVFWDYAGLYADLFLPPGTAEDLASRLPAYQERGLNHATVTVDEEEHVEAVDARIGEMGLGHYSLAEFARQVRLNLLLISLGMAFVAGAALVVAALGITNTMLMTVLERTHEIGVMKAVGARDVHIQWIFVVEGALIGLVGGGLGLLSSWLASFPGDALSRSIIEKQTHTRMQESLFVFPPWLTGGVLAFAVTVTTLAALYPARRAARVNPVRALRHE